MQPSICPYLTFCPGDTLNWKFLGASNSTTTVDPRLNSPNISPLLNITGARLAELLYIWSSHDLLARLTFVCRFYTRNNDKHASYANICYKYTVISIADFFQNCLLANTVLQIQYNQLLPQFLLCTSLPSVQPPWAEAFYRVSAHAVRPHSEASVMSSTRPSTASSFCPVLLVCQPNWASDPQCWSFISLTHTGWESEYHEYLSVSRF